MFPVGSAVMTDLVLWMSAIAIVYTSLVALVQEDMKKLIAYSSVAHTHETHPTPPPHPPLTPTVTLVPCVDPSKSTSRHTRVCGGRREARGEGE
jgi:hypothetical protein